MAGELIDLVNDVLTVNALGPVIVTGTTQLPFTGMDFSSAADCPIAAIINVGAVSVGLTTMNVQLEECATTNGTYTAITGTIVTITTTGTTVPQVVKGMRQLRYVRANVVTATGATINAYMCVDVLQQLKFTGTGGGYSRSPST